MPELYQCGPVKVLGTATDKAKTVAEFVASERSLLTDSLSSV
jgi:hypothetical protein